MHNNNNNSPVENAVAALSSRELQHVRRALETEMLAAVAAQVPGTQAHAGALEMLAAVGAELDRRGHLLPFLPWQETDLVDGARTSFAVRVY